MGRGRNGRRRASHDGPAPNMMMPASSGGGGLASYKPSCTPSFCPNGSTNNSGLPPLLTVNNTPPTNHQEILDAIEFHWKNLSMDLKQFLMANPQELSLRKFVDYWTNPVRIDNANPNIAASICGCSWYLALNYMSVGMIVEARALILNGCFLQQCYNKPIAEIAKVARDLAGESFREELPFFTDGLLAISSEERMSTFLRNKVSSDYQRRMSFATQTTQTKKKVQDYVNQISGDWNNGGASSATARRKSEARRRATLDDLPPDSFIEIKLVDSKSKKETKMRYGLTMPLKTLFKKYAEDRNLSLRDLRFSYEGRTLFLSSVGNKTPQDLAMADLDSIMVINNAETLREAREEETSGSSSSDESKEKFCTHPSKDQGKKEKGNNRRRRKCRRASWAGRSFVGEEERAKLIHSTKLTKVFNEASPQFEQIRQKLAVMNLECSSPKIKVSHKRAPVAVQPLPMANPSSEGTGGKAGVPFYAVHVGAPENLYNTKDINKISSKASASIDLHGMTKEEAVMELDAKLPTWVNMAMRGSHPFVIRVVIICGGGNQILSEAVDGWIKSNENVARAPKKRFNRRRTVG